MKRAGGRRFYRPTDIAVLGAVRRLLHDEGYTIKGVQKLHKEQGLKRLVTAAGEAAPAAEALPDEDLFAQRPAPILDHAARTRLEDALHGLEAAKARLDGLLKR